MFPNKRIFSDVIALRNTTRNDTSVECHATSAYGGGWGGVTIAYRITACDYVAARVPPPSELGGDVLFIA